MYPSAMYKTSDKSFINSARMEKIKFVVMVLVRIKCDVFTHRFKLKPLKISMSHQIPLKNNSCTCGNYQVIKVSLFSFVQFNIMIFQ